MPGEPEPEPEDRHLTGPNASRQAPSSSVEHTEACHPASAAPSTPISRYATEIISNPVVANTA